MAEDDSAMNNNDADLEYYKIKSPVKKPNLLKKTNSKIFKSNLIDMGSSSYNPEDSIGKRLRDFELW